MKVEEKKHTGFAFDKNDLINIIKNKGDPEKIQTLLRSRSQGYKSRLDKWKNFRQNLA